MIYLLLGLLPMVIYAGSSSSDGYIYTVKVLYAENLPDEDPDAPTIFGWQAWVNKNDPYVQCFGYGTGGDDKIKVEETRILEGTEEPEWNEELEKYDDGDSNGPYDRFLFKIYDDDSTFDEGGSFDWANLNDPDYLGETREIKTSEITDCEDIFEFRLEVTRDGKGCGLLVVEISKTGCSGSGGGYGEESSSDSGDDDDDKDTDKDTNTGKGGGSGGGGGGKTKGRRLLEN